MELVFFNMILPPAIWILTYWYMYTLSPLGVQSCIQMQMAVSIDDDTQPLIMNGTYTHQHPNSKEPPPTGTTLQYNHAEMLAFRYQDTRKLEIPPPVYNTLKDLGIFRYRSRRAGRHIRRNKLHRNQVTFKLSPLEIYHIPSISSTPDVHISVHVSQPGANMNNLTPIARETYTKLNVHLWNRNLQQGISQLVLR